MEAQAEGRTVDIPGEGIAAHVVQAVEGKFCLLYVRVWLKVKI